MISNESRWQKIYRHNMFLPILSLGLVLLFNLIKTPSFFNITINNGVFYGYIIDILNRSSELVILAVGMTIVVASSGGVDISVGAVAAVSGAVCIFFLGSGSEYAIPYMAGFGLSLLTGSVCGAWNGFLVSKLKIQPMVATLILFTAGRGIAQLITSGQIMYVRVPSYKFLANFIPGLPLPTSILLAAAVVIITSLLLRYTALGMYIQSVGINPKSSRLLGLNSNYIIFLSYTFCGLCSGVAGMLATSRVYSIDANNCGLNIELDAILAVALGGNSLAGGRFSMAGSVIGAVTIQALTTSLLAMKVSADQLAVYKAIVVVIIVALQSPELSRMFTRLRNRLIPEREGAGI
jgi:simple sugar transport system permease protein